MTQKTSTVFLLGLEAVFYTEYQAGSSHPGQEKLWMEMQRINDQTRLRVKEYNWGCLKNMKLNAVEFI
jgi:hypothetical protein